MAQPSESYHDTKEKLHKSVEDTRRSHLTSDLERLSQINAWKNTIPPVETMPSAPLDPDAPYIRIKGVFRTRSSEGPRGVFVILAHGASGEIVYFSLWAGYGGVKNADLKASWQALSVLMEEESQPQDRHLRQKAVSTLQGIFSPPAVNRIATDPENSTRMKKAEDNFLADLGNLMDMTFEGNMVMELGDGKDPQKFLESRMDQPEDDEEPEETPEKDDEIHRLSVMCGAVIDPVKGKPVASLSIGEQIYVVMKDGSPVAQAIRKIMIKGGMSRLPAPIISIEPTVTGNVEIFVELSEGVYGKLLAADTYKVSVPSDSEFNGKGSLPVPGIVWFALYSIFVLLAALIILLR